MLYRAAMVGIIGFWLVMMGLLVRIETHPETTDILDVPVSFVMRLMFRHGQTSFLNVLDGDRRIGMFFLRPSVTGSDGRTLNFSGDLTMPLPTAPGQRVSFGGAIAMDAAMDVRDFHADFSTRLPAAHLHLKGDGARKILSLEMQIAGEPPISRTVPMDGMVPMLAQNLSLSGAVPAVAAAGISAPAVTAREAQITLRGEQLEVYQVTVAEGTAATIDFYVTQLGQIVSATTNFGYSLTAEE
jgi:hypothetical protein